MANKLMQAMCEAMDICDAYNDGRLTDHQATVALEFLAVSEHYYIDPNDGVMKLNKDLYVKTYGETIFTHGHVGRMRWLGDNSCIGGISDDK